MSGEEPATPPPAVADHWATLLADAEDIADDYRDEGWDPLVIHPGDVTALHDDRVGLSVLAPDNEFERLNEMADETAFDRSHVYQAEEEGITFLVIVVEGEGTEAVVIVPAYVLPNDRPALQTAAEELGRLYTHVRPLADEPPVSFEHEDPAVFF